MPNLYNKLMAKDMPGAAPAPTARQMVQAPMGLRSAMRRYAEGGNVPQGMTPPPPENTRENPRTTPTTPPPEMPLEEMLRLRGLGSRYEDPRPDPRPVMPEIYPVKPEIYPKPQPEIYPIAPDESTITLDDGTVIQGYKGIGTPEFFAHYANDPVIMAKLREAYGFTGDAPEYREPQTYQGPFTGYNEEPARPIDAMANYGGGETTMPIDTNYDRQTTPTNVNQETTRQDPREDERLSILKRAMQGQGVGSLIESQRLAELLRSMGYSK
jgi:hypothetical protein